MQVMVESVLYLATGHAVQFVAPVFALLVYPGRHTPALHVTSISTSAANFRQHPRVQEHAAAIPAKPPLESVDF